MAKAVKAQQEVSTKVKNIGIEIVQKDIDLEEGNLVGTIAALHQGQLGSLKLTLEGSFSIRPLLYKGIDWLEEKIPGDQTALAAILKAGIDNIKL